MGCCLSKTEQSFKPYPSQAPPPPLPPPLPRSPPVEEETVKEVLSETPTTKPPSIPKIDEEMEMEMEMKMKTTPSPPKIEEEEKKIPLVAAPAKEPEPEPEISEGMSSEICTLSETISTNTMTTQDKNELEDGEVVQPRLHRSPAKFPRKRSFPGDSTGIHQRGSKSPARRSDPSPGRRNDNALKSAYYSDLSQTQTQSSRRRVSDSNINHTNRIRRDSGECSGRRSRSPATRVSSGGSRTGVGRSPSRRSGRSPARAPQAVSPEKIQKQEEETKEAKEGTNPTTNESMENPLVSLECFIFL